jgi:hypothetical protein
MPWDPPPLPLAPTLEHENFKIPRSFVLKREETKRELKPSPGGSFKTLKQVLNLNQECCRFFPKRSFIFLYQMCSLELGFWVEVKKFKNMIFNCTHKLLPLLDQCIMQLINNAHFFLLMGSSSHRFLFIKLLVVGRLWPSSLPSFIHSFIHFFARTQKEEGVRHWMIMSKIGELVWSSESVSPKRVLQTLSLTQTCKSCSCSLCLKRRRHSKVY